MQGIIYRIAEENYYNNVLSQGIISLDYVDLNSKQLLSDFTEFKRTDIFYAPTDFLFLIDENTEKKLLKNKTIELHEVQQFGFYFYQKHKVKITTYLESKNYLINQLYEFNPSLTIASFDIMRNHQKWNKIQDVLSGGLGLSYFFFRDEYNNLFSKFQFENNKIIIDLNEIDLNNSLIILMELFLFSESNYENKIFEKIFNNKKQFYLVYKILRNSLEFFVNKDYSMTKYIDFIIEKLENERDSFFNEYLIMLRNLNERFCKKGLSFNDQNRLVMAIKEFLELATTENEKIPSITNKNRSKLAIFLLGMLNLGSRLGQVIKWDNFIPVSVNLLTKQIIASDIVNNQIELYINEKSLNSFESRKLELFKNYISDIKIIEELSKDYHSLKLIAESFNKFKEVDEETKKLNAEIKELNSICNKLNEEKKYLIQKKEKLVLENKELKDDVDKLYKRKENLKVRSENLKKELELSSERENHTDNEYSKNQRQKSSKPKNKMNKYTNENNKEELEKNKEQYEQKNVQQGSISFGTEDRNK